MLIPAQRERLRDLFDAALECDASERTSFVDGACAGDEVLRAELLSLLGAQEELAGAPFGSMNVMHVLVDALEVPERIGPYSIVERIAHGGMGVVFRARQELPVPRTVALKLLPGHTRADVLLARFAVEGQLMAMMEHPNIATIYDAGEDEGGRPYFAMEYVDGPEIHRYCDRHRVTIPGRLTLLAQVCRAVQHAHNRGVVHRDLKPSNILIATIDDRPVPKVIDFGIAKVVDQGAACSGTPTRAGTILGTPEYMSPEQALSGTADVDTRADVYSLGVVLYQLLTGSLPLDRETLRGGGAFAFPFVLRDTEPLRPSDRLRSIECDEVSRDRSTRRETLIRLLEGDLDAIAMVALAKDREQRYASAEALADDLERHLRHEPILARPMGRRTLAMKFFRRHRRSLASLALLFFTTIVALSAALFGLSEADAARRTELESLAAEHRVTDPLLVEALLKGALAPWPRHATLEANLVEIEGWLELADDVLQRSATWLAVIASAPVHEDAIERLRALREDVSGRTAVLRRHWPLWDRCRADLEVHAQFEGLAFHPLVGLLPLGIDIDRDTSVGKEDCPLWAFVLPGSGTIPAWVDADGRPAPYGTPGRAVLEEDTAVLVILLPGGTYIAGAQVKDPSHPNYVPRELVGPGPQDLFHWYEEERGPMTVFVEAFFIGSCEVTEAQFGCFSRASGHERSAKPRDDVPRGDLPVVNLEFQFASAFCEWLGGSLPREVEWEYACRAGTATPFWSGSTVESLLEVAWFKDNARSRQPVASRRRPNPFGLHDVHGNVSEWCLDRDETKRTHAVTFAKGHYYRMLRGGSFMGGHHMCRSSARVGLNPGSAPHDAAGLRFCMHLEVGT